MSVWSRGRYLIPRFSSSASTSSGTRPFTRTAYTPRTYFATIPQHPSARIPQATKKTLTRPLPPRHPALTVHDRDDALKVRRRARRDAVLALLHLHDLLAVRAPVPPEVGGRLDDGA